MRLRDLFEAPLTDFQFTGRAEPGSFRDDDLRAFHNPKWLEKVRNAFSRTPYEINVYAYNGDAQGRIPFRHTNRDGTTTLVRRRVTSTANMHTYVGILGADQFSRWFGDLPPNAERAITVVFLQNEGGDRMPMTPWILAHRMVHALAFAGDIHMTDSSRHDNDISNAISRVMGCWTTLRHRVADATKGDRIYVDRVADELSKIGTTRAIRANNLTTPMEFVTECVAQYLVTGRVRFDRPDLQVAPGKSLEALHDLIGQSEAMFNERVKELLDACVGKLFVV